MLMRRETCILMMMLNKPMIMFNHFIVLKKSVVLAVLTGKDLSQLIQTLLSSVIADLQHFRLIITSMT